MTFKIHQLPPRLACGAFLLHTGFSKRTLNAETAAGLRDQAARVFPALGKMDPVLFGKLLSTFEISLGTALVIPIVPTWLVSAGLIGFSGMLMGVYLKTPELTQNNGIRPSPAGMPIARDVFMLGSAIGLFIEEMTQHTKRS